MTHDHDPLTEALRDNLHRHAADAPTGDFLAERIISAAEQEPRADRRPNRGWRTWALPLIAAGAVAAVVGTVVGVASFHTEASHTQKPGTQVPSVLTGLPSQEPTPQLSPPPTTLPASPSTVPSGLEDVRVTDLTFVGDNDGWALASANCIGKPGRCTALLRTTDGHTWLGMPGAEFNVPGVGGCADPCVRNIRFANDDLGYAFGPKAFFMTNDGGKSWQQQPGGALQLETLDNNVIRVTSPHSGCPGPCDIAVATAAIGSTEWTPADIAVDSIGAGGALLSRGGSHAYLLITRNPAGGGIGTSILYRSSDDGQSWTKSDEPCTVLDAGEVDSTAIAAGGDDRVTLLCTTRQPPQRSNVAWSDDGGANFGIKPGEIPAGVAPTLLTGDPTTVLVAAGYGMARSIDGGHSWQRVDGVNGEVGWVGFESPTVGRAVSADGSTIWTTRDAGATWRPATID
jgi:photosystem II stability/assembly factor-like uncharacterized protein